MQLNISVEEMADEIVMLLDGECDVFTAPKLKLYCFSGNRSWTDITRQHETVVLDCEKLSCIDAAGLNVLTGLCKCRNQVSTRPLVVRNPSEQLMRRLTITGLVTLLRITHDTPHPVATAA